MSRRSSNQRRLHHWLVCFGVLCFPTTLIRFKFVPSDSSELATWVGALGSVGAVISAIWIMNRQNLLNERNRLAEREHAASKEHQEKLDQLATCLLIAANTVSGTISSLNTLASVDDSDVPWTVTNQIAHIARVTEPTLRIPMHELGAVDAVLLLYSKPLVWRSVLVIHWRSGVDKRQPLYRIYLMFVPLWIF